MTNIGAAGAAWPTNQTAVAAWKQLYPSSPTPTGVELLKPLRRGGSRKSHVFRLDGVGEHGASIVAKHCLKKTADLETLIYSQLLPTVPGRSLRFYGSVSEPRADRVWIFIEHARGEEFVASTGDHSAKVAAWLGQFHAAASRATWADLPARGAAEYFEWLQEALSVLKTSLAEPALSPDARKVLEVAQGNLELLCRSWAVVDSLSSRIPESVVHGDLSRKHVVVQSNAVAPSVAVFDWEFAGRGVIAPDLGTLELWQDREVIDAYHEQVVQVWPDLGVDELLRIARLGRVLRRIVEISWACRSLAAGSLRRPIQYLTVYNQDLSNILRQSDLRFESW